MLFRYIIIEDMHRKNAVVTEAAAAFFINGYSDLFLESEIPFAIGNIFQVFTGDFSDFVAGDVAQFSLD